MDGGYPYRHVHRGVVAVSASHVANGAALVLCSLARHPALWRPSLRAPSQAARSRVHELLCLCPCLAPGPCLSPGLSPLLSLGLCNCLSPGLSPLLSPGLSPLLYLGLCNCIAPCPCAEAARPSLFHAPAHHIAPRFCQHSSADGPSYITRVPQCAAPQPCPFLYPVLSPYPLDGAP